MSYYRLYARRGSLSGPIVGVEEIHAASDEEAISVARRRHGDCLELWQQGRKVASFAADRERA